MKQFILQLSLFFIIISQIQAGEKWEIDTEGEVPTIQFLRYVDDAKEVLVGTGMQGMLLFSTDGGKEIGAYQYTTHDWVSIAANDEVIVFGGRDYSQSSTQLIAYTYDKGKTVNLANIESTKLVYNISLRDYPAVYYTTYEGKVFKSDSNFTDWQEYAVFDFKVDDSRYDDFGNLWLVDYNGKVFKSTDNGKTYEEYDFGDKDYSIRILINNNGYLIMDVNGEDIALCTSDGGETWKTIYNSKEKVLLDLCIINENLMYKSYFKGAFGSENYRSTDGGQTFETFEGIETTDSTYLQFCFKDETYGFAYGTKNFWGYLVRYTNDTGIEEYVDAEDKIEITPNPSSDYVNFDFEGKVESIEIVDIKGNLYNFKNQGNQIDISQLVPGSYFLKIVADRKAYIKKFLVTR